MPWGSCRSQLEERMGQPAHEKRQADRTSAGTKNKKELDPMSAAKIFPLNRVCPDRGFEKSAKGNPLNTIENLEYVMHCYGITARYNEVAKNVELDIPSRRYSRDNRDNASLSELTSICARNRMPRTSVADYVKVVADRNAYNPVKEWISAKPWDGVGRFDKLLATVTVQKCDIEAETAHRVKLKNLLIRRWMLSAIAAVYMPQGFSSHGVLVLTGAQGKGKTAWLMSLVPSNLEVTQEGATLDPSNKDSVINVCSHWIVELGELDATFKKADIARLKSFVTQKTDKVRRPYDRVESAYDRRTVFCGSVNDQRFLVDDTGNRRWWTIAVDGIDYNHGIDMQQVWAELLVAWKAGEKHFLTQAEQALVNDNNKSHETIDPMLEKLLARFDFESVQLDLAGVLAAPDSKMSATAVLEACGYSNPTRPQSTAMSALLKKLTGLNEAQKSNGQRVFPMPKRRTFKEGLAA